MRGWVRGLLLVLAAIMADVGPAVAGASDYRGELTELASLPRARPDWPTPAEPRQLFFIQRSLNANTVVYVARTDAAGRLDGKRPVEAFWRRYNSSGRIKPLGLAERTLAYGVTAVRPDGRAGAVSFAIAALPETRIEVGPDDQGQPEARVKVGGRTVKLVYVYLEVDDSGLMPDVAVVDLYGYDAATGRPLRQRFVRR